jgi:hypothetical protein
MSIRLQIVALLLLGSECHAAGKLFYGSRAGMTVTVVSVSNLDTPQAIIDTKHTREDAEGYCREYVQSVTQECIDRQLAIPMNDRVTANCRTGRFVDFFGDSFQFLGKNAPNKEPEYRIRTLRTGSEADGSSASGYATALEILKALCPRAFAQLNFADEPSKQTEQSWVVDQKGMFDTVLNRIVVSVKAPSQAIKGLQGVFVVQSKVTATSYGSNRPIESTHTFYLGKRPQFILVIGHESQQSISFPLTIVSPDIPDRAGVRVGTILTRVPG